MNVKKRILSCIILLILLAAVCTVGYVQRKGFLAMGNGQEGNVPVHRRVMSTLSTAMRDLTEDGGKKIALTFDDGPHPLYTEQLLKGLKERNAKASFFITGQNVEAYPEIVREIHEEGHLIGNHTYNHTQLTAKNQESFKEEIIKTNQAILEVTGEDTLYIRPPYGSWNKDFEKELNMFPVLWNIDPLDWCSSNVSGIVNTVCAKAEENSIILMHDQYKTSVTAALEIVDRLSEEGYEFVTVDEILFD